MKADETKRKREILLGINPCIYGLNYHDPAVVVLIDGRSRYNISPMTNRLALQELDNVKILDGSNRMDYIQAIDSCKIAIAPYRRACVWSMAVIDCFCRGLPVIGPNFASFNEIIPDFLRYETVSKERLLVDKLLREPDFWMDSVNSCKLLLKRISPSTIVEAIMYQIDRIM